MELVKRILSFIIKHILEDTKYENDIAYYKRIEGIDGPLISPEYTKKAEEKMRWPK